VSPVGLSKKDKEKRVRLGKEQIRQLRNDMATSRIMNIRGRRRNRRE
jgi:hypothetical protein